MVGLTLSSGVPLVACGDDGSGGSSGDGGEGGGSSGGVPGDLAGAPGDGGEPQDPHVGGGGSNHAGAAGDGPTPADPVDEYFDAWGDWLQPPAPSETKTAPVTERRMLQTEGPKWPFDCQVVEHDIIEQHEEILNFDSGAEYVKPGVLLVGSEFLKGNLSPIPLPRAPITLSINVPGVTTATVVVSNPNVSNIQQGIATLQAEAEAATGGSYAAQLSYEQHTVQSTQEMAVKLGVTGGFDGLFASANFSAKFENEESVEKYTVVSKLMQQMYTITFAQDDFGTAREFFSPNLSLEDVLDAEADGFLARNDAPVFIGSVTYGRMVVFSATSSKAGSRQALQSTLQASGSSWSASAELSAEQKSFLASLDIEVLSIGGNQAQVTGAIKTGDWSDLYAGADILNSVPLRYTVHSLSGTRPIAAIGDTTSFTTSECSPVEGWYERTGPAGVQFTDVSTNPGNDPVMLIGQSGGTYAPYRVGEDDIGQVPGYAKTSALDVSVDDVGNAYIYDASVAAFSRLALGSNAWSNYPQVTSFGALAFDAGAQDFLVALTMTYSDNQNDLFKINWNQAPSYWFDESQNMKYNEAPWFAAVGNGYIGRHGGEIGLRANDGGWTQYSADTAELNTVQKFTAASANELYALRVATGQVVRFNSASKKFDSPIDPPPGKSILRLEATSNKRLWAITSDGKLYAYSPPR